MTMPHMNMIWAAGVVDNALQHGLCLYWNKNRKFYFDSKFYPKSRGTAISAERLVSAVEKGHCACGEDRVWWENYHAGKVAQVVNKPFAGTWDEEQGAYVQPEEQVDNPLFVYGMRGWELPLSDSQLLAEAEKLAKQHRADNFDTNADKRYYLREVMQDHGIDALREALTYWEGFRENSSDITGWLADMCNTIHEEILNREVHFDAMANSPSRYNLGRQEEDLIGCDTHISNQHYKKDPGVTADIAWPCWNKPMDKQYTDLGSFPIVRNEPSDPEADIRWSKWDGQSEDVKHIDASHTGFRVPVYPCEKRKMRRITFPK